MKKFSISDIESLIGVKAHTLRAWESRYNLVPPKRTATNIRYYDEQDLKMLLNVVTLNENGYKISKIAGMSQAQINSMVTQLNNNRNNDTVQVAKLSEAILHYNEETFSKILSSCIKELGLVKTMDTVLFPLMKRIGMLWQTRTLDPAHEVFAANLIRDQLIVAIDKLKKPVKEDRMKFLLFLPESEIHDAGLLFARYLLKKCGQDVLYLGHSIPYTDIHQVIKSYQPDYAFTVLTSLNLGKNVNKIINKVMENLDIPLLVAGSLISEFDIIGKERLIPLKNVCDMVDFLEEL